MRCQVNNAHTYIIKLKNNAHSMVHILSACNIMASVALDIYYIFSLLFSIY